MDRPPAAWSPVTPLPDCRPQRFGTVELNAPVLTPSRVESVCVGLTERRPLLLGRSTDSIVESLCQSAESFLNSAEPEQKLLSGTSGYSPEVIAAGLVDCFEAWTPDGFREWMDRELASDEARGPSLVFQVQAGNVPTAGLRSMAACLLLRSPLLIKPSSGEPLLPALWAECLARHDPELAEAVAVLWWPGGTEELEAPALQAAEVVEVFGDDASIGDVRRRLPTDTRLIPHGHKISIAVVNGQTAGPAEAAALARDVAMFDQHGCLSPQIAFVLDDGTASARWASQVADAMVTIAETLPPGRRSPAASSRTLQLRGQYEFRPESRVWSSPGSTDWTVILTDPDPLPPTPGTRTLFVCPIPDAQRLAALLVPIASHLQAIGLSPDLTGESLALPLQPWFCPLGQMQRPPLCWPEDGMPLLAQIAGDLPSRS